LTVKNFPWFLLLIAPVTTLYRWSWNFLAALRGKGAAGQFQKEKGWWIPISTIFKANLAAVKGLIPMLRKRRRIRGNRRLSDREFLRILWRHRISARELALKNAERP
jgi:hypothetical protein